MSKIDYLSLDGRLLNLLLVVHEECSVTHAADRLGITQSAVSHSLDKLRTILGDPLFIRAGRGILATKRADALVREARALLSALRQMTENENFDPQHAKGRFVIAAADHQRDLLLPRFQRMLRKEAPGLDIKIMNSGVSDATLLREEQCDLLITPNSPEGAEFTQQKLFEDQYVCFFDPVVGSAPKNLSDYLTRKHVQIVFSLNERALIDDFLAARKRSRQVVLQLPNFSALPYFMRGQDLITVLPSLLKHTSLKGFQTSPCPFDLGTISFYQVWHAKNDHSPLHKWARRLLRKEVLKVLGAIP